MSFLNPTYSATVAARLTQKGRNAIASGNFNVSYFAVGDSEYNYNGPSTQTTLEPFDKDVNVKYPFWYTSGSTFFGVPISNQITSVCRNVMTDTGWTSNVVWEKNPIGYTTTGFTNFPNSKYLGIKSFFGYSSSSGQTSNTGTTITNTIGNQVVISPEEQKAIAILHYSGGTDVNSFFKYDDYISTYTGITSPNTKTDKQYFSVTIPDLKYHRSTGTTFYMTTGSSKTIVSNLNSRLTIDYMDLVDSTGNTANVVGKIFQNHKLIVIDDEEIVASLDPTSNRTHTLPAPFVSTLVTNNDPITALTTGTTIWITYMLSGGTSSDTLPCNYHMKVVGSSNGEAVTLQFSGNSFNYLNNGYTATKFYILYTLTNNEIIYNTDGSLKSNNSTPPLPTAQWYKMDYSTSPINLGTNLSGLTLGPTFTIYNTNYTGATQYTSPLTNFSGTTSTTFGTVNLVRASDIEEMSFDLNLPNGIFESTQNPTYPTTGTPPSKYITEVALLNNNKETLVMGKLAAPIQRLGSQIVSVKIDF
jgi:hypothetical protein